MIERADHAPVHLETEVDVRQHIATVLDGEWIYVPARGWLRWDGRCWAPDVDGTLRERVGEIAAELLRGAGMTQNTERKRLLCRVLTGRGIDAIIRDAESDPHLRRRPEQVDARPHLLNCLNGTIDLRDGSLHPHNAADMITHCAPTTFVPDATDRDLDRLLSHLVPDREVAEYFRRALGYAITGETAEDVIILVVGAERCGKTTALEAMRGCLGSYFGTAQMRSFCVVQGGGNGARSDLFRLHTRRVIGAQEIHPHMVLDSGLLKSLAGGGEMPVREVFGRDVTVPWIGKLILVCNDGDLPHARVDDNASWERIRRIPVGTTLPIGERDTSLRDRLRDDPAARSATLAWLVAGAKEWYQRRAIDPRNALGDPPTAVRAASDDLRAGMDPLTSWIAGNVDFDPAARVSRRALRTTYEQEATDACEQAATPKRFATALRAAGARAGVTVAETTVREGSHVRDAWKGVRLRGTRAAVHDDVRMGDGTS